MKTIKIKRSELVDVLATALDGYCGMEWSIYVNVNGNTNCRRYDHDLGDWDKIIDMYSYGAHEQGGLYPGDDEFDYDGVAEWIVDKTKWKPHSIGFYDAEGGCTEFDLELI